MKEDFFETIIDEKEYICGNKFISLCTKNIFFCKTDYIDQISFRKNNILITHNSDLNIDEERYNKISFYYKWYAQNKCIEADNLECIPIGIENFLLFDQDNNSLCNQNIPNQNCIPKKHFLSAYSKTNNNHKNLIYMNFNPNTNLDKRAKVWDLFNDKKWIVVEKNVNFVDYYKNLENCKFVISPDGNGVDCHRVWESLYLRTIPVVKRSICMESFSDLPILIIDDWGQVTEEFLLLKYEEMKNKKYNLDKLKFSYWENLIRDNDV